MSTTAQAQRALDEGTDISNMALAAPDIAKKQQLIAKAYKCFSAGIELFSGAPITKDELLSELHYNRGTLYEMTGQWSSAINDFTVSIATAERQFQWYAVHHRALCRIESGDFHGAIDDLSAALFCVNRSKMSKKDMDTSLAEVINDTGVAYDKLGEHDKAVECYTKSLELELDYSVVFNRGEAYYKAKKFDLAEMDLTTIVESSESKDDILGARYGRALSRMQKGEVDQAVVDFSANIKEDPGCADSMYGRAFALARKGEASYTAAIRDCMAALDVRPAMMSARRLLLRLCAGRDEPDLGSWLTRARLHEIIEWIRREMILVQVAPLDPESEATLREMDLTGVDILTLSGDGSPNTLRQRLHNGGLRLGVAHDVQKAIRAALARSSARADPTITRESILGDTIQGRLVLGPELKVPSSRSGKDKEREKDKEKEKKRKADAESSAKNSKTNSTKNRKRDKDSRRMPEDESS